MYMTAARPAAAIICTTGLETAFTVISFMKLARLRSLTTSKTAACCASALKTLIIRWLSSDSLATRVTSPIEAWMRAL